jgi:hypothetical protein
MTDQQLLTLAIAIVLPLSILLYSNSRITEAKETLRAEIQALRSEMQRDFMELRMGMNERFNSIDRKLDELLRLVASHDQRIARLEARP